MKKGIYVILTALIAAVMILSGCDTGSSSTPSQTTPTYGVTLDPKTITFAAVAEGYATAPAAEKVTVSNPAGNGATGELSVTLGGADKDNFTLSKPKISTIKAGETGEFTVQPKTGLAAKTYTATVTVAGTGSRKSISEKLTVNFTVNAGSTNPTYNITVAPTALTFAAVTAGYTTAPAAQTVTVSNAAGNAATGQLTVALEGTNAGDFTLSATSITNIAPGASETFTVQPKTGLTAGAHTASVKVYNTNITVNNFASISFTVNAAARYGVTFSSSSITIPAAQAGYTPAAQTLTITNPAGNTATGALTVALEGTNATDFTVAPTSINDIAAGATSNVSVTPKANLTAKTYTATVKVSNANITTGNTVPVTFTVNAKYGITVSTDPPTNPLKIEFADAVVGYAQPAAKTITVTNAAGNTETGALVAALSGTNASSFTLSTTSVASINGGGTGTFTVRPNANLAVGAYTASITVANTNIPTSTANTITVTFTVAAAPIHGITLNPTTHEFDAKEFGYAAAPAALTITVTNTSTVATGELTIALSGGAGSNFTTPSTSTLKIASIPAGSSGNTATFTVQPKTGLAAGTHSETVTVSGANNISATATVRFTVHKPVPVASDFNLPDLTTPVIYDGTAKEVSITPKTDKSTGAITITYGNSLAAPINAGSYVLTFAVAETTTWGAAADLPAGTLIIAPKSISGVRVASIPPQKVTGSPITPTVTVTDVITDTDTVLVLNRDYTVGYDANIEIGDGTAEVTITGINNYTGTKDDVTFSIIATNPGANLTFFWDDEHGDLVTSGKVTVDPGETVTITKKASASAYTVSEWYVDGTCVATNGNDYTFSSLNPGFHNVSLVVTKGGEVYTSTIVIEVK